MSDIRTARKAYCAFIDETEDAMRNAMDTVIGAALLAFDEEKAKACWMDQRQVHHALRLYLMDMKTKSSEMTGREKFFASCIN